jgi:integrase
MSELPALFQAPSEAALEARLAEYARGADGAYAENTVRALRSDILIYTRWCADRGLCPLPASPATLAAFIDARATERAPATVRRSVSSVAFYHRAADLVPPTGAPAVRLALKRMARTYGTRQKQAEPLNRPALDRMLDTVSPSARLIDARNAALAAVAYDTLLRRSELVGLRVEDIARAPDGSGSVLVRQSKTDQAGEGAVKYLAADTLRLVAAWLTAAGLTEGALFRAVDKAGRVGSPLQGQEVPRLFRQLAGAAGLELRASAHSTRVGACQDMIAGGFEIGEVMQAGSWKTTVIVARYSERLLVQRGAARKLATLQNRS